MPNSDTNIDHRYDAVDLIPGGGLRWKFFRNCSNMARIATKLCPNAFQTIPDVSFFDAEKFFSAKFRIENFVFRQFGVVLGEPRPNGRQNQLARQILL